MCCDVLWFQFTQFRRIDMMSIMPQYAANFTAELNKYIQNIRILTENWVLYGVQTRLTNGSVFNGIHLFDLLKQCSIFSIHHHFQWTDLPVALSIIAIFNLVQMVLELCNKRICIARKTHFHDTRFKTQMGSTNKKYWNVAIFKLRLLSDQLHHTVNMLNFAENDAISNGGP